MAPNGLTFLRILVGFATLGVVWLAFPLTMFPFAEQRVSPAMRGC